MVGDPGVESEVAGEIIYLIWPGSAGEGDLPVVPH